MYTYVFNSQPPDVSTCNLSVGSLQSTAVFLKSRQHNKDVMYSLQQCSDQGRLERSAVTSPVLRCRGLLRCVIPTASFTPPRSCGAFRLLSPPHAVMPVVYRMKATRRHLASFCVWFCSGKCTLKLCVLTGKSSVISFITARCVEGAPR